MFSKRNAVGKRNFSATLSAYILGLSKEKGVSPFKRFWTTGFGRALVGKSIAINNKKNGLSCLTELFSVTFRRGTIQPL